MILRSCKNSKSLRSNTMQRSEEDLEEGGRERNGSAIRTFDRRPPITTAGHRIKRAGEMHVLRITQMRRAGHSAGGPRCIRAPIILHVGSRTPALLSDHDNFHVCTRRTCAFIPRPFILPTSNFDRRSTTTCSFPYSIFFFFFFHVHRGIAEDFSINECFGFRRNRGTISYNCIIYSINRKFLDIR